MKTLTILTTALLISTSYAIATIKCSYQPPEDLTRSHRNLNIGRVEERIAIMNLKEQPRQVGPTELTDSAKALPPGKVSQMKKKFEEQEVQPVESPINSALSKKPKTQAQKPSNDLCFSHLSSLSLTGFLDRQSTDTVLDGVSQQSVVLAQPQKSNLTNYDTPIDWSPEDLKRRPKSVPVTRPLSIEDIADLDTLKLPDVKAKVLRGGYGNQDPEVLETVLRKDEEVKENYFDKPLKLPAARKKAKFLSKETTAWIELNADLPRESRGRSKSF